VVAEEAALREAAGPRHSEVMGLEQGDREPGGPAPVECVARRETAVGNGEGHVKNSHPIAASSPRTLL
jgi:hypothetical protein